MTGGWHVAHAFNAEPRGLARRAPPSPRRGPRRLDRREAEELGPLLWAVSAALREVVGCEKTYVLQLAESEGFHHVHFHVVPRRADLPEGFRGARIFGLLGSPDLEVVAPARMDELALELRAHLVGAGIAAAP